jgi:RNA polymerase sigma factor (sigma-70 family)
MEVEMDAPTRLDDTAVRLFLERDYPRVVAAVALSTGDRAAGEDVVAEALARAWEWSERGEPIASLPAWVTRVALNLANSRWRRLGAERRARHRLAEASDDDALGPEAGLDIERALSRLSRRERQATVLRYYLGFDLGEIASTLGVSEGTVKTVLSRARKKLASMLGENDSEGVVNGA